MQLRDRRIAEVRPLNPPGASHGWSPTRITRAHLNFEMHEVEKLSQAMSSLRLPPTALTPVHEDSQPAIEATSTEARRPFSDSTNSEKLRCLPNGLPLAIPLLRKQCNVALFESSTNSPQGSSTPPSIKITEDLTSDLQTGQPFEDEEAAESLSPGSAATTPKLEAQSQSPLSPDPPALLSNESTCAQKEPDHSAWCAASVSDPNLTPAERMPTLIICDDIFAKHKTGKSCQECPERVTVLCGSDGILRTMESGLLQWESHSTQVLQHTPHGQHPSPRSKDHGGSRYPPSLSVYP
jgi:hypothetical protein